MSRPRFELYSEGTLRGIHPRRCSGRTAGVRHRSGCLSGEHDLATKGEVKELLDARVRWEKHQLRPVKEPAAGRNGHGLALMNELMSEVRTKTSVRMLSGFPRE